MEEQRIKKVIMYSIILIVFIVVVSLGIFDSVFYRVEPNTEVYQQLNDLEEMSATINSHSPVLEGHDKG